MLPVLLPVLVVVVVLLLLPLLPPPSSLLLPPSCCESQIFSSICSYVNNTQNRSPLAAWLRGLRAAFEEGEFRVVVSGDGLSSAVVGQPVRLLIQTLEPTTEQRCVIADAFVEVMLQKGDSETVSPSLANMHTIHMPAAYHTHSSRLPYTRQPLTTHTRQPPITHTSAACHTHQPLTNHASAAYHTPLAA